MLSLRPATRDDQKAIVALVRVTRVNPMSIKWQNFVVAVDEPTQAIVGIGQIKKHNDGSRELASIATAPDHQHQGIAHQVINYLLARHTGVLYLTCLDYLETFYQQFGFRSIELDEMTPYFRRLTRLAKSVWLLSGQSDKLLVMKRD